MMFEFKKEPAMIWEWRREGIAALNEPRFRTSRDLASAVVKLLEAKDGA